MFYTSHSSENHLHKNCTDLKTIIDDSLNSKFEGNLLFILFFIFI